MAILRRFQGYVTAIVLLFTIVSAAQANTSRYEFLPEQNMLVQTGGIAGVHWTYIVEGQFLLTVDLEAGTAAFTQVDANAVDDSPFRRTLDPNEVFSMTALAGTVVGGGTSIRFEGYADDGSSVLITLTFADDTVNLKGQTTPPPNSADFFIFTLDAVAQRKYSGGTGEPNDPYQIATAEDLMLLGESPEDYDKHFILTADIDLDPNLPGRIVFDKAVIPDFSGVFDGNGHTISNFTINGVGYLGLFGELAIGSEVKELGMVDVNIIGSDRLGGLVGTNSGDVTHCYCTGAVSGDWRVGGMLGVNYGTVTNCYTSGTVNGTFTLVGGLVGDNIGTVNDCRSTAVTIGNGAVGGLVGKNTGTVGQSYSSGAVNGDSSVGGLVGANGDSRACDAASLVTESYSTGMVSGGEYVGGLIGWNLGNVTQCYSTGALGGIDNVGGLVGLNYGSLSQCYSLGLVIGTECVGGLAGSNAGNVTHCYNIGAVSSSGDHTGGLVGCGFVESSWFGEQPATRYDGTTTGCFWDTETSGQTTSDGGTGKTTAEMQTASTFLESGWDFDGETANGSEDIWKIADGFGYPRLSWERYSGGTGEPNDPYQIATAEDLMLLGETPEDYDKHFILTADIDLDPNLPGGRVFDKAVIAPDVNDATRWHQGTPFTGVFDGNGHMISHLTINGGGYLGLFGQLGSWYVLGGDVKNLGVVDVNITGSSDYVGGLVGSNGDASSAACSGGILNASYSTGIVVGDGSVGGLAGSDRRTVNECYSTCSVCGNDGVGGLVGNSCCDVVVDCYSTGLVSGRNVVGGLVGSNGGVVTRCYSTGVVSGSQYVGGLVGWNQRFLYVYGMVIDSFWDTQTSGQATSADGTGRTTAEMQTAGTFLDAGWDFVGETTNGTDDIWWIDEGKDYPRLWWEAESN